MTFLRRDGKTKWEFREDGGLGFPELGMVCDVSTGCNTGSGKPCLPLPTFSLDFHQTTYPIHLSLLAPPGIVLRISTLVLF